MLAGRDTMRLAKGWELFTAPWVLLGVVFSLISRFHASLMALSVAAFVVAVLVALFFRDPERSIGSGIVAAADGRIQEVHEERIVTFLNVHDVHVVRAPYSGRVVRVERFEGPRRPAFLEGAEKNAGVEIALETRWGEQVVHLIAGLVARRAVAWVKEGQNVEKGQRIGMIRFSSRVDIALPDGAAPTAHEGDRVKAGETMLAEPPEDRL